MTRAETIDHVRGILYRYGCGSTVDAADERFLRALLAQHPNAARKEGCGVASIQVEQNLGTRGFWLTRTDGSRTDWSFTRCLAPVSAKRLVLSAMRFEVRRQVVGFRDRAFADSAAVMDALTGCPVTRDDAHVDHVVPFVRLAERFLAENGLDPASVPISDAVDGVEGRRLTDATMARQWREFHRTHAQLRVVASQTNLRRKRKAS